MPTVTGQDETVNAGPAHPEEQTADMVLDRWFRTGLAADTDATSGRPATVAALERSVHPEWTIALLAGEVALVRRTGPLRVIGPPPQRDQFLGEFPPPRLHRQHGLVRDRAFCRGPVLVPADPAGYP